MKNMTRSMLAALLAALLGGCALAPAYERPAQPLPAHFKEAPGWMPAAAANLERGPWWTVFGDPVLDELAAAVEVSNQNVAAAAAAYEQARAAVRQQRSGLFPLVTLDGGAGRSGGGSGSSRSVSSSTSTGSSNSYQVGIGASWEPDVWGRLRAAVNSAGASAQASAADLAAARLAAQGELAANYFGLRLADVQIALLRETITGYQRVLQITRNRYQAGVAPRTDVLQAETQLASAQAEEAGLTRDRAQREHAIAVLIGKAPADFSLAAGQPTANVPDVPALLPSTLLLRRPDIAAAERRVAAANEQIGIARSGYFPSVGLSASYDSSASSIGNLFSASTALWSLGLSAAQTLFDAGAIGAGVDAARAAHQQAAARYRQTVLSAFQDVEDQLSASQVLARQLEFRRQAAEAANLAEEQMLNRYRAGQVGYTEVVSAQVTALNARRALAQARADRQTAAVALIQSLGGGWEQEQ
ncbi:MAG TPA: efflux transporter outer membrane subunit [Noviherbaspirillum sp.]|jgi:NodT family efflux transporter outer membrane factor (OMF) lipoprotein|uniref:efflux transporter outer membrane subunit n=1 Tax=Noviherbaspirillum sp. TaxID=1926288 RepID=UPI002F93525B